MSDQLSFFDSTNITFKYVLPLEAAVGAARVSDVGEVELNLKAQTGHSAYDGFSSTSSGPRSSGTISNIGIIYSVSYVF